MMRPIFLLIFCTSCLQAQKLFPQLEGQALLDALREKYQPERLLSYASAKDVLYADIYLEKDSIHCVYSGHSLYLDPTQDPSKWLYKDGSNDGINCEHLWPKSRGIKGTRAETDLHHLVPTRVAVNQARSNLPFDEVPDRETKQWYFQSFGRNSIPADYLIDQYSELGATAFEPREDFKGNVARALFYIYTMYQDEIDAVDPQFFADQLPVLCQWHKQDPVDEAERKRSLLIAQYQDNKANPYILFPELVGRAFCN
ncbi:MAG TPA: endonuclease [Saprospiraceae bacterium]|nr:endonuclease [Saprospiraceae bacterium]HMQ82333.1 endonuclease [Saprospiraceae bacterium]